MWRRLIHKLKFWNESFIRLSTSWKCLSLNADCLQWWWTCQLLCGSVPLPRFSPLKLTNLLLVAVASLCLIFYAQLCLTLHGRPLPPWLFMINWLYFILHCHSSVPDMSDHILVYNIHLSCTMVNKSTDIRWLRYLWTSFPSLVVLKVMVGRAWEGD